MSISGTKYFRSIFRHRT